MQSIRGIQCGVGSLEYGVTRNLAHSDESTPYPKPWFFPVSGPHTEPITPKPYGQSSRSIR
ncbi:MAG: hypothetical protein ACXACD_22165, partial [Candidatus Thorarchaeota archaeon]